MTAFTHLNPKGSHFTDGSYGVFYAAKTINTAIAETKFHKIRFLAATNGPAIELLGKEASSDLRLLANNLLNQDYSMV